MLKTSSAAGENPRDHFERACQKVIAVLADPEPTESPEFREELQLMDCTLIVIAAMKFTRWQVRQPREGALDAKQSWHCQMVGSGYRRYLNTGAGRPFQPYAMQTLHNICVDIARKGRRHPGSDDTFEVADPHRDPSGDAQHRELMAIVREEFDLLSPTLREAVSLTEWDDFSATEVAEKLDVTPRALYLRTHRARRQLRDRLLDRDIWPLDYNGR